MTTGTRRLLRRKTGWACTSHSHVTPAARAHCAHPSLEQTQPREQPPAVCLRCLLLLEHRGENSTASCKAHGPPGAHAASVTCSCSPGVQPPRVIPIQEPSVPPGDLRSVPSLLLVLTGTLQAPISKASFTIPEGRASRGHRACFQAGEHSCISAHFLSGLRPPSHLPCLAQTPEHGLHEAPPARSPLPWRERSFPRGGLVVVVYVVHPAVRQLPLLPPGKESQDSR